MTVKWSAFPSGTTISGTDVVVGLQGGQNVQWPWSSVATFIGGSFAQLSSNNVFTRGQTITEGTPNESVLTSTGYSLTGSNATSMVNLSGTWNTTGTPTAIKLNITNTASNAQSLLMDLQTGGASRFRVFPTGNFVATSWSLPNGGTIQNFGGNINLSAAGTVIQGVAWFGTTALDTGISRLAAGSFAFGNGTSADRTALLTYGWGSWLGQSRASADFPVTSNDVLATVTGLTVTVVAGKTYSFTAYLPTTSNVAGGVKVAIGGTATATSIVYDTLIVDGGIVNQPARATSLATAQGATAVTAALVKIEGTITVNAGGTLTVQFAQNASNGSASTVLAGSTFIVEQF